MCYGVGEREERVTERKRRKREKGRELVNFATDERDTKKEREIEGYFCHRLRRNKKTDRKENISRGGINAARSDAYKYHTRAATTQQEVDDVRSDASRQKRNTQ